ncbi:hypothetical protein GH714_035488 [Hevea brasiliensis]|uniref:Uncharacterized protein n=1 Tax=Hevea brasiliensis TaxID=3981 RepID=A0A6A6NE68_HEVBR|nr:hypothetical protein GH714_035488 [Hevea brasiliensis]
MTKADVPKLKLNAKKLGDFLFLKNSGTFRLFFARCTSSNCSSLKALPSMASSASAEETNGDDRAAVAKADNNEMEFSRVNCLLWVLHESAASFSLAVQSLELPGRNAELAMAWNGKDVHEWHKRISYQVAVFPLLKMAIEVEMLLSLDRHNNGSPVKEIGVAGIIAAISCCAAVGKLGSGRISCPMFTLSIEDVLVELMDLSYSLVEVEKLHQLATEAGFELNFLSHFGAKILPCNNIEELEFWIGLAQRKLSAAFCREMVVKGIENSNEKVKCFASSYLECGILFIHPELATVSAYACFVELVTEEIGWLDFYATCFPLSNQERKRSKQHPIQAEKEIILSTVFTVGYDVFSGFAHFGHSTQQPLDAKSLEFLLQSQSLLTVCLEDYLAVYARTSEFRKIAEAGASDHSLSVGIKGTKKLCVALEAQQKPVLQGCIKVKYQRGIKPGKQAGNSAATEVITFAEAPSISNKSSPLHESLLRRYGVKLASKSSDVWMGTQLLFVDIMDAYY